MAKSIIYSKFFEARHSLVVDGIDVQPLPQNAFNPITLLSAIHIKDESTVEVFDLFANVSPTAATTQDSSRNSIVSCIYKRKINEIKIETNKNVFKPRRIQLHQHRQWAAMST